MAEGGGVGEARFAGVHETIDAREDSLPELDEIRLRLLVSWRYWNRE